MEASKTKIGVRCTYYVESWTVLDLPNGKIHDDIKDFGVKWGRLYITFKDGTTHDCETDQTNLEFTDWKRPADIEISEVDEEGFETGETLFD